MPHRYKMQRLHRYIIIILLLFFTGHKVYSESTIQKSILIISSYNNSSRQVSNNITDFIDSYRNLGGRYTIMIENMNCNSFSDATEWKPTLKGIFSKYQASKSPSMVIIFGQEAWGTYLSLSDEERLDVPVIVSMVSRNYVDLPTREQDIIDWAPESLDYTMFNDSLAPPVTAYMYNFDIGKNIELILDLYPDTENIVFLSDNTYGGVALQALVRDELKKYANLNLQLLDGRGHTIYTLINELKKVPENSAMLLGTWRIDKNDGVIMPNATYLIFDANPNLPAFTPTSVAMQNWAIGGLIPDYRSVSEDIAAKAYYSLDCDSVIPPQIELFENHLLLDYVKINQVELDISNLKQDYTIINKPATFYELYHQQIWMIVGVMAFLALAFLLVSYYLLRLKFLNRRLAVSEANLMEAKNAAEESNRLKSAFLANMSHEIRTPLNAIVGFTDVISSGEISQEEIAEYNSIIKSNSNLLLHLINDILDLSRMESGRVNLNMQPCNVVSLCKEALATVDISNKTLNHLEFESNLDQYFLDVDSQRLKQVLINLLSNALKFTTEGTITLSFVVDTKESLAYFSVSDTGIGIPKDKQSQVFDRFEKLNDYAQGTGLGLAICKLIVEKLGGAIWVDADYTDGARFIFNLPITSKEER